MSIPDYRLRLVNAEDHDFLWRLHETAYRAHIEVIWGWDEVWQRAHFQKRSENEDTDRRIVEIDSERVGYLELVHREDCLLLGNIQICPEHQGRGLGAKLLGDLMRDAASMKKDVALRVFKVNTRAVDLYTRLGFQKVGRSETHIDMRWVHRS